MKTVFAKYFTVFTGLLLLQTMAVSGAENFGYNISTTWNNQTVPQNEIVSIKFTAVEGGGALGIEIKAPFYNDTLPMEEPGRKDELWNFEVVEVFFLGDNTHYLELEFGPGGHYLVYYLVGVRNVVNGTWLLDNYTARVNEKDQTWEARAVIPVEYLPPNVGAFNAYAIHGEGELDRKYMALFPVEQFNGTQGPDFHRLDPFEPIDLTELVAIP